MFQLISKEKSLSKILNLVLGILFLLRTCTYLLLLYTILFFYFQDSFSLPDVAVRVVKQPKPKYVLVLESSSSMSKLELWKWVSKAVHKFIRNDLPSKSKVAVVTFSNDSSIEHNLGMYIIMILIKSIHRKQVYVYLMMKQGFFKKQRFILPVSHINSD